MRIAGPTGYLRRGLHGHPFGLLDSCDGRWCRMVASEGYLLVSGRQRRSPHELGAELARRATTHVAVFPLGYVFSMTCPESVVLALVAATVTTPFVLP